LDIWPSPGKYLGISLTAFNTFVLICSSVTMVKAFEGALANDVAKLKKYLLLTIMGGAAFRGMQAYEYTHFFTNTHAAEGETAFRLFLSGIWEGSLVNGHWEFENGGTHVPRSTLFGSTFFVLTAFHGCHVFSGVVYLFFTYLGVCNGRWDKSRIEILGLYWHFVDLVWIVIFTIVYLVETKIGTG
ncbi:MAG: cytochrome c oxidase subunit 3, partial [Planctomycetes bacterium]|nr:cytochrome c oxidase subunit 3 [Planctomycetota bacterium]